MRHLLQSVNTNLVDSCFIIQEMFHKQQGACVHRGAAARFHRSSAMGACFSTCLTGNVNGGQGTCNGRSSTKRLKYHRDWSHQLFSRHTRLFNQDNSTVGGLTSEDIDKARNAKKTDVKQYKQVVSTLTPFCFFQISVQIILMNTPYFSAVVTAPPLHILFVFCH